MVGVSRQGRYQSRTLENVKCFWEKEAAEWGESPQVTIRDHYFRLLEIGATCELIEGRKNVLDIGCGTGFSTLYYAAHVADIVGADYSPKMIKQAECFLTDPKYFAHVMERYADDGWPRPGNNLRFEVGDVLAIGYPAATFDGVIAQRVLINLPTVALQGEAVAEIARVLEPGGLWISVEATMQGHRAVDTARAVFGLPKIEKYWHNLYVDEDWFAYIVEANGLETEAVVRFETYQFVTKILHPLIAPLSELEFLSGLNKAAYILGTRYPTYESVATIGLEPFLNEELKPLVHRFDPEKLHRFEQAVKKVIAADPDFSSCSHQVMYVLRKPGEDGDSPGCDPDPRVRRLPSTPHEQEPR
jgi:ubiquinone/menaquinone biosynthesis C-methylase UbiE